MMEKDAFEWAGEGRVIKVRQRAGQGQGAKESQSLFLSSNRRVPSLGVGM
jgi:hypothetical protein